jgi:hypothetical protein
LQTRQPAPLAEHAFDVDLGGRLGERKIGRPQSHAERPLEELLDEAVQHRLQIGES